MIKKSLVLAIVLVMCSIPVCIAQMQESRLELDYGTSYKLQKYNQILNPDADKNLEPVQGIDGRAAEGIRDRYRETFKTPEEAPVYQLSIGGESKK